MKNTILGVTIVFASIGFYRWINQPPPCTDDPIQLVYSEERQTQNNIPSIKFNFDLDGKKLAQSLASAGLEVKWDGSSSSIKILKPGTDLSGFAQKVALLNGKFRAQKLCNEPTDSPKMQAWLAELNAAFPKNGSKAGGVPPFGQRRQTYFRKTQDGGFQGAFNGVADWIEIRVFGFDEHGQKVYCHPVVVNKCCYGYFEIPAEKLWLQHEKWDYEVVAIVNKTEQVIG